MRAAVLQIEIESGPMKPELTHANRHVGDRLRLLRGKMGLAQKDIARLLGVSHQQIGNYEDGSDRLTAGAIFVLSQRLGVDLHFFFEGLATSPSASGLAEEPAADYEAEPAPPSEGHRLDEAFARIRSRKLRLLAIRLVETVAVDGKSEADSKSAGAPQADP